MRTSLSSVFSGKLRGRPTLSVVPAVIDGVRVTDPTDSRWESHKTVVMTGSNIICEGMYSAIQGMMCRDFDDWQATSIQVGYGGDYSQPPDPTSPLPSDQGERVPPAFTDAYVRKPLFTAAIRLAAPSAVVGEYRWTFTATLSPFEGETDVGEPTRPFINEFGLLAANGTLLAHFIPPADGGGLAERRSKTDLEWWVIQWDVEFIGTPTVE